MSKFREPWPWEPGGTPIRRPGYSLEDEPLKPWDGSYVGFRLVKNTRCLMHNTPIIEVMSSKEGTYWKCQKCPDKIPCRRERIDQ